MKNFIRFGLLALALGGAGCVAEGPVEDADLLDLSEDDDAELSGAKADSIDDVSTYYTARRDARRCAFPLCGGYWVKRVNYSRTRCGDGRWASECYVATLDVDALGLDGELWNEVETKFGAGQAVLRGTIRPARAGDDFPTDSPPRTFNVFDASEAYRAASDAPPSGTFYRVTDSGLRCITFPCFSLHEAKLNSTLDRELSGVDLEGVGASEADVELGNAALNNGGLIAAGTNRRHRRAGPAGDGISLDATQFYVSFAAAAPARHCGGFAGLTCGEGEYCSFDREDSCGFADALGTCRPRPEACAEIYAPVCGCDGNTYGNECEANAAGTSAHRDGECAPRPGTCTAATASTACGMAQYCNEPSCGRADVAGMCADRPTRCTREFMPVCGCNGRTYSNSCNAAAAGVSIDHEGACETTPRDCRTSGCGTGQSCQFCWGSYACIPEGAVC